MKRVNGKNEKLDLMKKNMKNWEREREMRRVTEKEKREWILTKGEKRRVN